MTTITLRSTLLSLLATGDTRGVTELKELTAASETAIRTNLKALCAEGRVINEGGKPAAYRLSILNFADDSTLAAESAMDDAEIKAWNDGAATPEAPEGEDLIGMTAEEELESLELAAEFEATELASEINPFAALQMTQSEVAAAVRQGLDEGQAEIEAPVLLQDMIAAMPKAKKSPLNPQPVIDKKVAIMEAAGGSITYAARKWTITDSRGVSVTITSKEFAEYKGEHILDVFGLTVQAEEHDEAGE